MPSRCSSIRSLSWSISCFHRNPLLPKPHSRVLPLETLTLSSSQPRSSSPVLKHPPLAFPLLSPHPGRLLQWNHQATNQQAHPCSAIHTTAPEHHTSLPAAAALVAPLQERPSPSPAYTHCFFGPPTQPRVTTSSTKYQSSAASLHYQSAPLLKFLSPFEVRCSAVSILIFQNYL